MATRDGVSNLPRRKINTYGKTSRQRKDASDETADFLGHPKQHASQLSSINNRTNLSDHHTKKPKTSFEPGSSHALEDSYDQYPSSPDDSWTAGTGSLENTRKRKLNDGIGTKTQQGRERKPKTVTNSDFSHFNRTVEPVSSRSSSTPTMTLENHHRKEQKSMPEGNLLKRVKLPGVSSAKSSAVSEPLPRHNLTTKRNRLIDTLQSQVDDSSDSDGRDETPAADDLTPINPLRTSVTSVDKIHRPMAVNRPPPSARSQNLKFTYSSQRTIRPEEGATDLSKPLYGFPDSDILQALSSPTRSSNLYSANPRDDELDESSNVGGIRSIHELRQAGANSRFSDEIDDILQRIGIPSSQPSPMRRNALLELSRKVQQKAFLRQFRDHSGHENVLARIGEEKDIISGFVAISILVVLLVNSFVPRLGRQFQDAGLASLLAILLNQTEDINTISAYRKSNLSRASQSSISSLKSSIIRLDIWAFITAQSLSPRTLVLKFLELACKSSENGEYRDLMKDMMNPLLNILETSVEYDYSAEEDRPRSVDFDVALSVLEAYSIMAMESPTDIRWTSQDLGVIAKLLLAILARPVKTFGEFEHKILKLALNSTNNNPQVASAFEGTRVFYELVQAVSASFVLVEVSISQGNFASDVFNALILILGVMINYSEHKPTLQPLILEDEGGGDTPLDKLIRLYLKNQRVTSEVSDTGLTGFEVHILIATGRLRRIDST
jgi:hypothetical protein